MYWAYHQIPLFLLSISIITHFIVTALSLHWQPISYNQPSNPMLFHQFCPNEAIAKLSPPNSISIIVIIQCYTIVMLQDQYKPPKHLHSWSSRQWSKASEFFYNHPQRPKYPYIQFLCVFIIAFNVGLMSITCSKVEKFIFQIWYSRPCFCAINRWKFSIRIDCKMNTKNCLNAKRMQRMYHFLI